MSTRPSKDRSKIHIFRCQNDRCSWFDTDWVVQQLEDGTVPVREGMEQKTFPAIPGMTQEKAAEQIQDIADEESRSKRGR